MALDYSSRSLKLFSPLLLPLAATLSRPHCLASRGALTVAEVNCNLEFSDDDEMLAVFKSGILMPLGGAVFYLIFK